MGAKSEDLKMGKKVTDSKVKKLVEKWTNRLDISNYKVTVHITNPEDMEDLLEDVSATHDYAHVITSEEKQEADIYINKKYVAEEPKETEDTILHELIHVRLNELMESYVDTINSHVPDRNSKELLSKQLGKLEHKIVVGLTRALTKRNN